MSLGHGAPIVTDGLKFLWDPNSVRCTQNNRTGIVGSYSATSYYTNAITGSDVTITGNTPMYVSNKTYYTLVGLTYPEGSQAAPWAGRDGITPGISNTTAGKLYDCSRDLNYFVFDEDTNTWVPDSYFNGERINGHCYDTYDGAPAQHATFQADFDNISNTFQNATHIVIGSHAAENNDNDAGTLARLQSIGLPNSHIGVARPEYVLVGKVNRPDTWHYVRENVNSGIAVMNVGLPLEGNTNGGAVFNGSSLINVPSINFPTGQTIEIWLKPLESDGSRRNPYNQAYGGYGTWTHEPSGSINYYYGDGAGNASPYIGHTSGFNVVENEMACVCTTRDTSVSWWYKNGVKYNSYTHSFGTLTSHSTGITIGSGYAGGYLGEIAAVKLYDRALSEAEVKQNFNALRGRFGI